MAPIFSLVGLSVSWNHPLTKVDVLRRVAGLAQVVQALVVVGPVDLVALQGAQFGPVDVGQSLAGDPDAAAVGARRGVGVVGEHLGAAFRKEVAVLQHVRGTAHPARPDVAHQLGVE